MKRFDASIGTASAVGARDGTPVGKIPDLHGAVGGDEVSPVWDETDPRRTPKLQLGRKNRSELDIRREERCRIGRELHDSTSQLLVALQLRLARFKQTLGEAQYREALPDVDAAIQELHREIRAVMLMDAAALPIRSGQLPNALQEMAERFGRTSGLKVSLRVDRECLPRPAELESSIYRIAQEALANIWRHAQATSASIRLRSRHGYLRMSVEDDGVGVPMAKMRQRSGGTGLNNIRDRVRQLGGRLYIRRLSRGTRLTIVVAAPDAAAMFARQ